MVYVTRGLVDVLLGLAEDAEPKPLDVTLSTTPAKEFDTDLGVDAETPILTHFYLPEAGWPVSAVFGMDIGTPAGRGRARFITHPQGRLEVSERDHMAAVMVVAVPPWDEQSYAAFDRVGRRVDLVVLDAEPPQESLA